MPIATNAQMQEIERRAVGEGMSVKRLMENAGAAAARYVRSVAGKPMETVILCGKGNNGGDGFVIARKLAENAYPVTIILMEEAPVTAAAKEAFSLLVDVAVIRLSAEPYRAAAAVTAAAIVVDAVYGIGFHGELPSPVAHIFSLVKPAQLAFAIDIPSGLVCDNAMRDTRAFRATHTVTFTAAKPALQLPQNACVTLLITPTSPSCGSCRPPASA